MRRTQIVFQSIFLCFEYAVQEVIVGEDIVSDTLHAHNVSMSDRTTCSFLLHIFHALHLAQVLLVLNNVHDALNYWLVTNRIILSRKSFTRHQTLIRTLDRFDLGYLTIPFFLFASQCAELF